MDNPIMNRWVTTQLTWMERWRQSLHILLELSYPPTSLNGVTTQKATI